MKNSNIIIKGVTEEGNKFRPSDWAERLYYALASYGHDKRLNFNPLVHLKQGDKYKCFVINPKLEQEEPMTFDFLMNFATSNKLVITNEAPAARADVSALTEPALPQASC